MDINKKNKKFFIASINGKKCQNWKDFLFNIGIAFDFPDYYGQNLAAFRDCINDLRWLEKDHYMLIVSNSDFLLKRGDQDDDQEYLIKQHPIFRPYKKSVVARLHQSYGLTGSPGVETKT